MDEDSSTKFIGSLTKFLQSLCNGYVEFQRGVELVGHIYLSIDTGEKVDYILHEKVSKNDENSVSFVSNSFHAQPIDKKEKTASKDAPSVSGTGGSEQGSDDDDIVIVGQSEWMMPGSTNSGTIPSRVLKRPASSNSEHRQTQHAGVRSRGSNSPMSSQAKYRQQSGGPTATNQSVQQDNINIGDVKLEQISTDELLSLASQVNEGASSSHVPPVVGQQNQTGQGPHSLNSTAGQPVWIKQEMPDDSQSLGGHDTGWPRSRDGQSDSSNSGSDLYPVMMHQGSAYSSGPVFPGFSSHQSSTTGSHHGQSLPGISGAANPYANPMPGTSQGMSGIDPAAHATVGQGMRPYGLSTAAATSVTTMSRNTYYSRLYRQRLKQDPVRYREYLEKQLTHVKRYKAKKKMSKQMLNHVV